MRFYRGSLRQVPPGAIAASIGSLSARILPDSWRATAPGQLSRKEAPSAPAEEAFRDPHITTRPRVPRSNGLVYRSIGEMIRAKLLRARFKRLFTVPRLHPVISAISSYVFPSSSLRTKTILWCSGSFETAFSTISFR